MASREAVETAVGAVATLAVDATAVKMAAAAVAEVKVESSATTRSRDCSHTPFGTRTLGTHSMHRLMHAVRSMAGAQRASH